MALNFQQFQNRGGGGQGSIGSILSAVAAGMPSKSENLNLEVQDSIKKSLTQLQKLWANGFSAMKDENDYMDRFHFPSSIESWNNLTSGWGKREKLAANRAGINLLSYTQAFNENKKQLISGIENNIRSHQSMNELSDSAMRNEFEGMPNVAAYINRNSTDPEINNLVTPNTSWHDQLGGALKTIMPFPGAIGWGLDKIGIDNNLESDTLLEGAGKAATGITAYKYGPKAYNWATGGKGATSGSSSSILNQMKNIFKGATPVSTGPAGKQLNLFAPGGAPTKTSILKSLTQKLGKTRALSLLAKLPKNPYFIAAALLGMGIYSLSRNKGSYQSDVDARVQDTYGGGTPDYTGGNPQEAFAQAMAEYKSKHGLK